MYKPVNFPPSIMELFKPFFPWLKILVHDSKLKIPVSIRETIRHEKTNPKCYFVLKRIRVRSYKPLKHSS
jgi:hypothetical protein